jgi:hypothetical protein
VTVFGRASSILVLGTFFILEALKSIDLGAFFFGYLSVYDSDPFYSS